MSRPRLLVIGGGSIGERHVRCFQHTARVEVELCEINPQLCAAVREKYALRQSFVDFAAALASHPDLAVICTPANFHVSMARQLIEAQIPVLIEKPLSTTLDGVEPLIALAEARGVTASVAYVYRTHPALESMRQVIASGRLGRPLQLIAVFGQNFPFYRPAYRDTYYRDHATGGGAIQDALTHVINAAEWLVGPVTELVADAAHLRLDGVSVEDTVHLLARHADLLASYSLNQHQAANEGTLTVVCSDGMARFEMHQQRWRWTEHPEDTWHDESCQPLERDELFIRQAQRFLDATEGRTNPCCTLSEGAQTLRVNLAALRSVKSRHWETIDTRP